jgi:hypothetical protein
MQLREWVSPRPIVGKSPLLFLVERRDDYRSLMKIRSTPINEAGLELWICFFPDDGRSVAGCLFPFSDRVPSWVTFFFFGFSRGVFVTNYVRN